MSGEEEQQQQQVPGAQPWVYTAEEKMLNGHNGDVPPQPVPPVVEEQEIDVVWSVAVPQWVREIHHKRTPDLCASPALPLAQCDDI